MAELGHEVIGVEHDATRAATLARGEAPFYEPGLSDLLSRHTASGRLRFTTDITQVAAASLHFITVGTPQQGDSFAADLRQLNGAFDRLLPQLAQDVSEHVIVGKSTVPVGTAASLATRAESIGAVLVWGPEFLREGRAVHDSLNPDRLVYGLPENPAAAARGTRVLDEAYAKVLEQHTQRLLTDFATAELVKVTANSFLATKISFINAVVDLCEATGADITELAAAIGLDARIGDRFLQAGIGFGGGCLPKDLRALIYRAAELGAPHLAALLRNVDEINQLRRDHMINLVIGLLGGRVADAHIAVLGAAFKPDTDDIRDSPALEIAYRLQEAGAAIRITDPRAGDALASGGLRLDVAPNAYEAAAGAELVLFLTDWREFQELDPHKLLAAVSLPRIVDGRNTLVPQMWRTAGWEYHGVGRPRASSVAQLSWDLI